MYSCASTKKLVKVKPVEIETIIDSLQSRAIDYIWFSAKARIKFEGPEMQMGGRCNIRMIKDSLIWMNFKKLSIEGSRALIRKDSFWIVYRIDKMYESGTLQELLDAYDLDVSFSELQEFVVGNYPIPRKDSVNRYRSEYFHELAFRDGLKKYEYQLDGSFFLAQLALRDNTGRQIIGKMEDYNGERIATTKAFEVVMSDGTSGTITFNLSNIEFDVPKTIPFEVPSHYIRLP